MKFKIAALCFVFLAWFTALAAAEPVVVEQAIPAVSDPPYAVGDHATIQGHYISLEEGIFLNFRIVDNLTRIYWVDADDLILEPRSNQGSLRLRGSVRGAKFHGLQLAADGVSLKSSNGLIFPPHIFNVILNLEPLDGAATDNYTFRFLPMMGNVRETRELDASSTD